MTQLARELGEEVRGPGTRVAAVFRQAIVDAQGLAFGQGYELLFAAEVEQIGVVLNAGEAVVVGHLILVEQDFARAV